MQRRIRQLAFLTISAFCLFIGSFLWSNPTHAAGGNGKKNDQIHVHIQGGSQYITSVAVVYKGQTLVLEKKSAKLYSIIQPGDIVKPDISEIIVTRTDGTKQVFSPASRYAGVEGNGTINYWITVTEPKTSGGTPSGGNSDDHHSNTGQSNHHTTTPTTKSTHTSSNTTHHTINGGKLPVTATPWYNLIALGVVTALFSGLFLLRLKRRPL